MLAAHQFGQLVMHDLDDHLLRTDCLEDVLSEGFLLNVVTEAFCYLVADIGVEKGFAHILHRFGNVYFRNLTLSLNEFKGFLKSVS